jgi:tRNA pseudouridine55 synthase
MDFTKIPLVFNVKKPVGLSSFNVVHHFKKNLNFDFGKIGHFGTLDPFAEGVLLIGIQGAQKLNDYVHDLLPKTYQARGVFGGKTLTGDLTVEIAETKDIDIVWQNKSIVELQEFLSKKFMGEYWQRPHAVSATKFEGKRLYQHALEGRIIEKEKVKREIYDFKILDYKYPYLDFEVCVSSGTYVRSLFEEIAELLCGFGALLTLKRTAIGNLKIENSLSEENWPLKKADFDLNQHGIALDQILVLAHIILTLAQTKKYLKGQRLAMSDVQYKPNTGLICSENCFWVYNEDGTLLGFARHADYELQAIFNLNLAIAIFS